MAASNAGTSINFDAQALLDQDEEDYRREEQQQQNEVIIYKVIYCVVISDIYLTCSKF